MAPSPEKRTFPCPKCNRTLTQSGEIYVDEHTTLPTFQCDECLMTFELGGERMEIALTFALDAAGKPFDPADPDGQLLF